MREFLPRRRRVGGLRIDPRKARSTQTAIAADFVPRRLFVPLHGHHGAAARPCVEPGQNVLKGQPVGLGEPASGTPDAHASSSGTVVGFTTLQRHTAGGAEALACVVIETDGQDSPVDGFGSARSIGSAPDEQLEAIRRAGIVGLGGASVSTSWKLTRRASLDTLIVNGAECEPYISCDDMLMREHAGDILAGSLLLLELLGARRCIVAIERDKPQAIAAIRAAAAESSDPRLQLAEIPSIYPAGGERQLVELLIGAEVPSGAWPTDIGILCQNVGTASAVNRALRFGEPLISRVVTLTGEGIAQPRNAVVRIGTTIADLVKHHGGYVGEPARLIVGGSMMGIAQSSDALPVTKGTNCILVPGETEFGRKRGEWPCIRCGECAAACPARLLPQELLRASHAGNFVQLQMLGLDDCIECGCCDAICPSQIALTSRFVAARAALGDQRESERFGQLAQARFDARARRRESDDQRDAASQAALRARVATERDGRQAIEAALQRAAQRRGASREKS